MVFQRHFVVSAQRMADPIFGTENSPQAGMADEADAAQVEHFALVPVGRAPDVLTVGTSGSSPATSFFQRGSMTLSTRLTRFGTLQRW